VKPRWAPWKSHWLATIALTWNNLKKISGRRFNHKIKQRDKLGPFSSHLIGSEACERLLIGLFFFHRKPTLHFSAYQVFSKLPLDIFTWYFPIIFYVNGIAPQSTTFLSSLVHFRRNYPVTPRGGTTLVTSKEVQLRQIFFFFLGFKTKAGETFNRFLNHKDMSDSYRLKLHPPVSFVPV
jgi:hypothetical protein